MKIDDGKEFGIYQRERQGTKHCRKIYSDHNAIILNIDFIYKMEAKYNKKSLQKRLSETQENYKTKTNK